MKALRISFLVCVCLTTSMSVFGQTQPAPAPQELYPAGERVVSRDLNDHNQRVKRSFDLNSVPTRESRVIKSGILAPATEDIESYKQFLTQKNTGLIRLLPRGAYNIKIRGGGGYYSFSALSHDYNAGPDIELSIGLISSGFAGADYGILTNLADATLDELTLDDTRVTYLAGYKPPSREPDARAEFVRSRKGFRNNGQFYARMAVAEVDSTYLLRSIVYDKSDVLVAFRVVRIDEDNSITIAWKFLKKYSIPKLSR